ncbi:MAG: ATP-dependent zinc protease [Candidatus Woesearchaeota archaeon]|nr:MAG: ATP-dependent zinc protease [Candidatus Woesearchaeota archaeon]
MQPTKNKQAVVEVDGKTRSIIGLVERVKVFKRNGKLQDVQMGSGENGHVDNLSSDKEHIELIAKVDTGATKSSIDFGVAKKLGIGPVLRSSVIRNAHGSKVRPLVEVELVLEGHRLKGLFSLADRSHLTYPLLIGQNILTQGDFVIDPTR